MAKEFKTILDEIQEIFGELHLARVAQFQEDKVSFGIHDWIKNSNESLARNMERNQTPIDGEKPRGASVNREERKQLRLPASSTIQSAAYFPTKEYLIVSFKSGHTYDYTNVPVGVVQNWEMASSSGHYFYYNIRMSYTYRKLG